MTIQIQVKEELSQLEQFAEAFNVPIQNNKATVPSYLGEGFIKQYDLPYQIKAYHYFYNLKKTLYVESINQKSNGLYMLQINLSNLILTKSIAEQEKNLSAQGKCGVLYYSPGNPSRGGGEINQQFNLVFFTFPKQTYEAIIKNTDFDEKHGQKQFCLYTELSTSIEQQLKQLLKDVDSKSILSQNSTFLDILDQVVQLFSKREYLPTSNLKMNDVEILLQVKAILEKNVQGNSPTISELANQFFISQTKLKTNFKTLFGTSIYKYYLKLKMENAKNMIVAKSGSISEISHLLGYSNPAQFSAQFRKHFGVSPSQF